MTLPDSIPDPRDQLLKDLVEKIDKLSDRMKNIETHEVGLGEVIEDQVLTSDTASFDFQSIPAGWRHLRVNGLVRSDRADITDGIDLQFNGDTGANYNWMWWDVRHDNGTGLPVAGSNQAAADTTIELGFFPAASAPASFFGPFQLIIPHYQVTAAYKTTILTGGHMNADAIDNFFSQLHHGMWLDASVISRITLMPVFGSNWVTGSRMTLYGLS